MDVCYAWDRLELSNVDFDLESKRLRNVNNGSLTCSDYWIQ